MASHINSAMDVPPIITVTKQVRLRSSNDTKRKFPVYTNVEFVGKRKDTISIPAHYENACYQENYESWPSSSPTRLLFRYLGVYPNSGETCHDFGHYNRVARVDFTRRFNSVPVIFQITEQLSNVKTVNISLNASNIVLTPRDNELLRKCKPRNSYVSFSVRNLTISVTKWKNDCVISSLKYHRLRLRVILEYAKLNWENIENIQISTDDISDSDSTACDEILKFFRDDLFAKFSNINISFATFTKKDLCSSGKKTNNKTQQQSIATKRKASESKQTFHDETNCHASPASNQSTNSSVDSRRSSTSSKSLLSLSPREGNREFTSPQPLSHKKCEIPVYTLDDDDDDDGEPEMEVEEIVYANSDITDLGRDLSNDVQRQNSWRNHPPHGGRGNGRYSRKTGPRGSNPSWLEENDEGKKGKRQRL